MTHHASQLEGDALRAVGGWFHHDKETTMTTPQQIPGTPPRSFLSDVAGVLGDLASNQLLDEIAQQGIGRHLQPADRALVLALIPSLEAPHLAMAGAKPQQAAAAPANT
jgi:hypothetical protein